MRSAHVIYISPKMQTASNAWCLSGIAGEPAIRRLTNRLRRAFGECSVLCHEDATAQLIAEAIGAPVEVSPRPGRYSALLDFVRKHELDCVALYPDTTIFPDCDGVAEMLSLQERTGAAATLGDRYPLGLYPEVLSKAVFERFEHAESTQNARNLMERANQSSWDKKIFSINDFAGSLPPAEVLEVTGASLLLWSVYAIEAASSVVDDNLGIDSALAFGRRMMRAHPTLKFRRSNKIRILFSTLASYYAGAEESFSLLAGKLDRTRCEPVAPPGARHRLEPRAGRAAA